MRNNTSPNVVDALFERIEALESIVRTLATARRIGDTAIDGGSLTVRGGSLVAEDIDGSQLLYIGQGAVSGVPGSEQAFMRLSRANGKPFFVMTGANADRQYWLWHDSSGNPLMGDDIVSGQGLARPYLPYAAVPTRDIVTPPESTTSATFTALWTLLGRKQHPRLHCWLYATADAGTVGEFRIVDPQTGEAIAGPVTTGSAPYLDLIGELPGAHMSSLKLDVEARRTSGTGTVRVQVLYAYGIQS